MTIEPPEVKHVTKRKVACDGGGGALGHPRVWLHIPEGQDWIDCPYCDTRYVYDAKAGQDAA